MLKDGLYMLEEVKKLFKRVWLIAANNVRLNTYHLQLSEEAVPFWFVNAKNSDSPFILQGYNKYIILGDDSVIGTMSFYLNSRDESRLSHILIPSDPVIGDLVLQSGKNPEYWNGSEWIDPTENISWATIE